eukprot:m.211931 g.211931  ORF g.211931 m.211931 type:complete len:53 (+) comp15499_c1_seq6:919-1077(+)
MHTAPFAAASCRNTRVQTSPPGPGGGAAGVQAGPDELFLKYRQCIGGGFAGG